MRDNDTDKYARYLKTRNEVSKRWNKAHPEYRAVRARIEAEARKKIRREGGEKHERLKAYLSSYRRANIERFRQRVKEAKCLYIERNRGQPLYKWQDLRGNARRRGIDVEITYERACELYREACAYCYATNGVGVDRVDSNIGYEPGNVVACCTKCNMAKGALHARYFIEKCGQVRDVAINGRANMTSEEIERLPRTTVATRIQSFWIYRTSAKKRGYVFDLTKDEFMAIVDSPCTYCSRAKGGVDRMDNSIGYTKANSTPCCATCNRIKGASTVAEFVSRCIRTANIWQSGLCQ